MTTSSKNIEQSEVPAKVWQIEAVGAVGGAGVVIVHEYF